MPPRLPPRSAPSPSAPVSAGSRPAEAIALDDRRRRILDAASKLLRHYGHNKTTVADIAREANVSVGSVYLEFASKDAIIGALSACEHRRVLDAMTCAALAPNTSFAQRLRALFRARLECSYARAQDGTHAQDLLDCGACTAVTEAQTLHAHAEHTLLSRLLADAHSEREFHVPNPHDTAQTLLIAHASYAPPWVFKQPKDAALRSLDALHDILLSGLLRR